MPPVRTLPTPVKPVKTERTHEENQERAYIAASRRSDRSLEARVESARRASEIHKRRTGRSLRVTEQDVVNEEMYEEEDDDLPMQYRRLAAHLNAGNSGLNKRLAAYLTNHIAMRSALGQAISNANQQFPNPTDFSSISHPPWLNSQQHTTYQGTDAVSPHSTQQSPSSASYRHTPYPLSALSRNSSSDQKPMMFPPERSANNTESNEVHHKHERRASEPVLAEPLSVSGTLSHHPNKSLSASPAFSPNRVPDEAANKSTSKPLKSEDDTTGAVGNPQYALSQNLQSYGSPLSLDPLSTSMPRETLMYPGYGFDHNNPFGTQVMPEKNHQSFYGSSQSRPDGSSFTHPSLHGMSQTLAPSMTQKESDQHGLPGDGMDAPYSAQPYSYGFDESFQHDFSGADFSEHGEDGGDLTPSGDNGWAAFIDQSSWD